MYQPMDRQESIRHSFTKAPIRNSLIWVAVLTLMMFVVNGVLNWNNYGLTATVFLLVAIRMTITAVSLYFVGIILSKSGFKFAFQTRGFVAGFLIASPLLIATIAGFVLMAGAGSFDFTYAIYILPMVLLDLTTGFWEETLFRGLLMTAFLVALSLKWDESLAWRLVLVIACAVFFGLLHYDQGFTGIIITGVCGLLFGAAYVYSKNLLSIILLHALNNSVNSAQNIFIRVDLEMTHHFDGLLAPVTIVFCVVGVVVSIAATIKATPFMPPVSEETK